MILVCNKCKLEWDYQGKKVPVKEYVQFTTCPRCHTLVKLVEKKLDELGVGDSKRCIQ